MPDYVFIYNANSGIGNALIDYGKKLIYPADQDCELCTISYGPFGMKSDWKRFIKTIDGSVSFLHKDEFEKLYPEHKTAYPAFAEVSGKKIDIKLSKDEFKEISNLSELISAVKLVL